MFRARLSAAVVVFGALIALALVVAVPRASAVEPFPELPKTMLTPHFAIHYATDPGERRLHHPAEGDRPRQAGPSARTPSTRAGATRRRPPEAIVNPGYIDIVIASFTDFVDNAVPTDAAAAQTSGTIALTNGSDGGTAPGRARASSTCSSSGSGSRPTSGLEQAAAEWAAFRLESFTPRTPRASSRPRRGRQQRATASAATAEPSATRAGDSGWTFMEYLERALRRRTSLKDALRRRSVARQPGRSRRPSTSLTWLTAKGASFESVFTDYTVARLTGQLRHPLDQGTAAGRRRSRHDGDGHWSDPVDPRRGQPLRRALHRAAATATLGAATPARAMRRAWR